MTDQPLRIMQVSTADVLGGAEAVAANLSRMFHTLGQQAVLAVGRKRSDDSQALHIRHDQTGHLWQRLWWRIHYALQPLYGRMPGAGRLLRLAQGLAEPGGVVDALCGREDFRYPGTWFLPELTSPSPDVIHCHNLHSRYFDLRALPWLSRQAPLFITLHDAWLLTGHCAHSFGCERWKTGCGSCPDLSIYPAVHRDATAFNWRRKSEIYAGAGLRVATPSRWLMEKVEQSMLWPGIVEARVIPNGVDVSVFKAADQRAARAAFGWPHDAHVLLFAANGIRKNIWKDFVTLRAAVTRLSRQTSGRKLLLIALGEEAPAERVGEAEIRFVPRELDPHAVARYYQAADVYVHAALADTFPTSVIEALACGTPVVATAVGGIPEQVKPLSSAGCQSSAGCPSQAQRSQALPDHMRNFGLGMPTVAYSIDQATGALVARGDAEAMAVEIQRLLDDETLRHRLGRNAAADAAKRFNLRKQAEEYLNWYREVLGRSASHPQPATTAATLEPVAGA